MKAWFNNYMNGKEGKLYICPLVRRCKKNGYLSAYDSECRHTVPHEFEEGPCDSDAGCIFTFSDGEQKCIPVHCIEVRSKVSVKCP